MADMGQVLSKLVERTRQNRIPWSKGSTSDEYRASVGNLTFAILGPRKGTEGSVYLEIKNHKEEIVGNAIYVPHIPGVNYELVSIFDAARDIASDDPRLDEVLDALDAVPPF